MNKWGVGLILLLVFVSVLVKDIQLLNVFYDLMCELYEQYNKVFSVYWKQEIGDNVVICQLYGGFGKQVILVINGIEVDVVMLVLVYDVDVIVECGCIDKNWLKCLLDNFVLYIFIIVFFVCKGNLKQIYDWNDLIKLGVLVIILNLKSFGGVCWNYLVVWGYVLYQNYGDQVKVQEFVKVLYKNVEVLDFGVCGLINIFVECGIGDVLIVWENEVLLVINELGKDKFEIVILSELILVELIVLVVDKVVDKKGMCQVVEVYLKYFYLLEGQEIVVKNFYCLCDLNVVKKYVNEFLKLKLFIIDQEFGGWMKVQKEYFFNGGIFDQISQC